MIQRLVRIMNKRSKVEAKKVFLECYEAVMNDCDLSDKEMAKRLGCPYTTLKQTISKNDVDADKLNADIVISFCHRYGNKYDFDVEYIYYGETREPKYNKDNQHTIFKHSEDCQELQDDAFMGTFYGYTYNTMHNAIDNFILNIDKTSDDICTATLELECFRRITDQKSDRIKKTLYGKPMHLKPNLVYIVFQADKGDDIYVFAFRYFKINYGKRLYCRYGSIITNKRETVRYPQMQSFVFFDSPIKQENMHYIEGFLKLSNDKILVPADIIEENTFGTQEQKERVKKFFTYCNDIQFHKEEYYCFSEKVLLALGESKEIPKDIIASTLMTLKEKSINPSTISYPDNTTYSKFLSALSETEEIIFNEDDEQNI